MEYALEYAPGVVADDTVMTRGGRYIDADKVRFLRAGPNQPFRPEMIGGWERLTTTALTGLCRTVFAWTDNSDRLNIAFGTHAKLQVWRGGAVYDITPYGPPSRLGADPLATTNASGVVVVTHAAHGYADGIDVKIYGAAATNGIDAVNINGARTITYIDADSYSFTAGAADTATSTASGGGSSIVVVPQTELPAGQEHGTGTAGYSTGAYGVGGYGSPSTDDYFPRTWSFGTLGEALIASPRDGAIYMWENDTSVRASWLENSPLRNAAVMTTPERVVMALGSEEEASPYAYNPRCIRHSDPDSETTWTTATSSLAREKILEGAGRLVAGRNAGPASFIWTDNEVFQADYVGALDEVYRFTLRGSRCGLIGPNAAAIDGQTAIWLGPEIDFHACALGGEPQTVECPMRDELRDNLTTSQSDKIVISTLAAFDEVWVFYPDSRDGLENSRAMFFSTANGWWSKASTSFDRLAFCDAGPADNPVGVDADGNVYWHERGDSADGGAIAWALQAGPQYIDAGRKSIFLRRFWPDFREQIGGISLTLYGREKPQSDDETFGPYVMTTETEEVSLHLDARILSWKISGESAPAFWRLGTPLAEGKPHRRAK